MRRQRWTLQKLYGSECMRLTTKHASHEEGHFFCCRFLILLNFIQHIFPREISSCLMFSSATNFVACVIRAENVPWSVIPKDPIMPTQFWNGKRRNFYHFISNETTYIKNIVIYSFTKNCLKMRPFSNSCRFTPSKSHFGLLRAIRLSPFSAHVQFKYQWMSARLFLMGGIGA